MKQFTSPVWNVRLNPKNIDFLNTESSTPVKTFTPAVWKRQTQSTEIHTSQTKVIHRLTAVKTLTSPLWNRHTSSMKMQTSQYIVVHTCVKIHTSSVEASDPIHRNANFSFQNHSYMWKKFTILLWKSHTDPQKWKLLVPEPPFISNWTESILSSWKKYHIIEGKINSDSWILSRIFIDSCTSERSKEMEVCASSIYARHSLKNILFS